MKANSQHIYFQSRGYRVGNVADEGHDVCILHGDYERISSMTRGMYSILPMLYPHRCLPNEDSLACYIFQMVSYGYHALYLLSGNLALAGIGQVASFFYARKQIRKEGSAPVVPKASLKSVGV